jgi:site-specific DNA recombinase
MERTQNTMKCIIYLRQSLDLNGDELGIERQRGECQRLCTARGYEVVETIVDNSVSASKHGRAGYARLVDMIERRAVEVVVILRIDRLLRLNDELEALVELSERTGVRVATVEGDIDLSTPSGRLVARVLVSVARAEMETKSARHRLANEQKARAGKSHGSRRPYGYTDDHMSLYEPEAEVLREMARRILNGHTYKEVSQWANEQGHTTTFGKPWYPVTVRNLLRKPRYGGYREYHGATYPALWPAVFDSTTYERLMLTIKDRNKPDDAPKARRYLLTGLLYCGTCGHSLNGSTKRDRPNEPMRRTYRCVDGCRGLRRNADALDHFVRECVLYRLDTPELAEMLGQADDGQLGQLFDIRALQEQRLNQIVDDYAMGVLDKGQFVRAKATATAFMADIDTQIANARREMLSVQLSVGETLREAWERETDGWRRQLLNLIIKKITVNSGNTKPFYYVDGVRYRFDPNLVEIEWRC